MTKITPFLWFDNVAGEAAKYYVSIFPNSRIVNENPMFVTFEIAGQTIMALNGGPQQFKFTEAISFFVDCEDQAEVDRYWNKLVGDGGAEGQCGWLKDKYGLSWQIVPRRLGELFASTEPGKAGRVNAAMLKMHKLIVKDLEAA